MISNYFSARIGLDGENKEMPSIQARILNSLLKCMLKPAIHHYSTKLLTNPDIKTIYFLRNVVNCCPAFIPTEANITKLAINGISVTEVSIDKNFSSTILYLHGGAYILGLARIYLGLAYRLAAACSAKVLLVDYSLAPEKKFPAALNDVLNVYEVITQNTDNSLPLFIAGDSCGGGLALATLVALRDKQMPLPTAAICLSPWADLALTGVSLQSNKSKDSILSMPLCQLYATDADKYNPLASPLYANLHGLPPLFLQVSDIELLFDDARRISDRAIQDGVNVTFEVYEGLPHAWHLFAKFLPEGVAAIQRIGNFIKMYAAKNYTPV